MLVEHVLAPLAGSAPVVLPTWDWTRAAPGPARPRPDLGPPRPAVLLVEGAGAGARPAHRTWPPSSGSTLPRPSGRSAHGAGRPTYAPHWDRWAQQEQAHFARERTRQRADLVLDTTPGPDNPIVVEERGSVASRR